MALGRTGPDRGFQAPDVLLGDQLVGLYAMLAEHGDRLFPVDYFADLYSVSRKGRPTIPARVVATVMVLQSHEGLSDYEAVDRIGRDLGWQAAAGLPAGAEPFDRSVLVRMRALLRGSDRPKRFLVDTVKMAHEAGVLLDRARTVDSTPVYDAVATQDTVTQLRSVIRTLLRLLDRGDRPMAARVRAVLVRDDDYKAPGKPSCDWDDPTARDALVDELVREVLAAVGPFEGNDIGDIDSEIVDHVEFMVYIAGQDTEQDEQGRFRIARRVAKDRVISTVDREARHGHKSKARKFDGFKAHIRSDPDSEIIDEVIVTPANTPDAEPLTDLLANLTNPDPAADAGPDADVDTGAGPDAGAETGGLPVVYGDAGYGSAETLEKLIGLGYEFVIKVPSPTRRGGLWSKTDFGVDTDESTVTCPTGITVPIRFGKDGSGTARFADACDRCPLRVKCTTAADGRTISIHRREDLLQTQRHMQANDPAWAADYKATRPKVERKIGHLIRKPWGGRRARMRGAVRIEGDLVARAAAINLDRLARIGVIWDATTGWTAQPP